MVNQGPQNKITKLVVGLVIGAGIVVTAFTITGPWWGVFCLVLALYEGWTLVNRFREDTISETIWELAARPMVPLLFGVWFGVAAGTGYLGDVVTVLRAFAVGFLFGHFFFQRFEDSSAALRAELARLRAQLGTKEASVAGRGEQPVGMGR